MGAGRTSTLRGILQLLQSLGEDAYLPGLTICIVVSRMAVVAAPLVLTLTRSPALRPLLSGIHYVEHDFVLTDLDIKGTNLQHQNDLYRL